MKAQAIIMEKMVLMFFIGIILIAMVLFLGFWNITQFNLENQKNFNDRAFSITKRVMTDPLLVKEDSVFDSSKLQAANQTACQAFEKIYGREWFIEVSTQDDSWSLCVKDKRAVIFDIPVNVYDASSERVSIGKLRVGVYR